MTAGKDNPDFPFEKINHVSSFQEKYFMLAFIRNLSYRLNLLNSINSYISTQKREQLEIRQNHYVKKYDPDYKAYQI